MSIFKRILNYLRDLSSWDNLRHLTSGPLFASTSIFLFMIPAIAHFSTQLPDPIEVPLSNRVVHFDLFLPFRWILLYGAALFATLANLVYFFQAPNIIRHHHNYSDFQASGFGAGELIEYLREIVPNELRDQLTTYENESSNTAREVAVGYISTKLLKWPVEDGRLGRISTGIFPGIGHAKAVQEQLPAAFSHIRRAAGFARPIARYLMFILLTLAILCFSAVLIQNAIWVLEYLKMKGV